MRPVAGVSFAGESGNLVPAVGVGLTTYVLRASPEAVVSLIMIRDMLVVSARPCNYLWRWSWRRYESVVYAL